MERIQVLDKRFRMYMPEAEIQDIVRRMAADISRDYKGRNPILCPILTGSFMFAADLMRELEIDANVSFVRYSSYLGMATTGSVKELMGFPKDCRARDVIIIEDIIDSGISMDYVLSRLRSLQPASVSICTLFFKPGCFTKDFPIQYIGKKIANDFIVGYGLDYNGLGRTYRDIYILDE